MFKLNDIDNFKSIPKKIEDQSENKEEGDSILTITITTINYGTVGATIILESSNSVQVAIVLFQQASFIEKVSSL